MIANDLLHSAAQSCSKDVVSIGTGNLEDGLCAGASEGQTGLPKPDWGVWNGWDGWNYETTDQILAMWRPS